MYLYVYYMYIVHFDAFCGRDIWPQLMVRYKPKFPKWLVVMSPLRWQSLHVFFFEIILEISEDLEVFHHLSHESQGFYGFYVVKSVFQLVLLW